MFSGLLDLVTGLRQSFGPLTTLLLVFCALAGVILVVSGIRAAALRADLGPSRPGGWAGPIASIIAGLSLVSFSTVITTLSATVFRYHIPGDVQAAAIFTYAPELVSTFAGGTPERTLIAVIMLFQFLGLLAVARGVFILRECMQGHSQKTFGAGITHMIGGVLAYNLPRVAAALENLSRGGA